MKPYVIQRDGSILDRKTKSPLGKVRKRGTGFEWARPWVALDECGYGIDAFGRRDEAAEAVYEYASLPEDER